VTPTPQEPPNGDPHDEHAGGGPDDLEAPLRGWIDPSDRLWRHPSETAHFRSGARARVSSVPFSRPEKHRRGHLMIVVGAAATMAAVAWVVILLSPASAKPSAVQTSASDASDAPMTTLAAHQRAVPAVVQAAGESMVQLRADTSHGEVLLAAVAVAEGGLVATTADALDGLRSISMVGPGGHLLRASVVAIDHDSDLALVNVPDDVPVAPFDPDNSLAPGSADFTLTMAGSSGGPPTLQSQPGTVAAVGRAIATGPADGMPSIVSSAPGVVEQSGDPLLNAAGGVVGILYGGSASGAAPATFLPSELVLGVADDLRSTDRVAHGWLGVKGSNAAGAGGATVVSISAGSPAAGRLNPGEVIVGVDAMPVRTMAELRGSLYVLAPNASVALTVLQGTATRIVDLSLSGSP